MTSPILQTLRLGHPWQTLDPFLFCVHHLDHYPQGNAQMGIDASLRLGRQLGSDFSGKEGWSMYHGRDIPGFPPHPHRGFETVTVARQGFIDHADSMGAKARFGHGDVQWMTAGKGILHSEMFPLVHQDKDNPTELFQIWLNLPAADKMVEPHFTMFWHENIPVIEHTDTLGKLTTITAIAGNFPGTLPPPPNSWAAHQDAHVGIFTLNLEAGATYTLTAHAHKIDRCLYFFEGDKLTLASQEFGPLGLQIDPSVDLMITNPCDTPAQLLILEGHPLDEPVVQHGPFVMNSAAQIQQALRDYQRTQFGGWPHGTDQPVWPKDQPRFALHANGHEDTPT